MTIDQQVNVLSQITQVMHDSTLADYEEMTCQFDYFLDGDDWSIDSEFSFISKGKLNRGLLKDSTGDVYRLVHTLHELMKAHTGGSWRKFVLSIDGSGRANTKFIY